MHDVVVWGHFYSCLLVIFRTTTMTFLPYPEIPFTIVHSSDIVLLLTYGFLYQLFIHLYQHKNERRTSQERKIKIHLATLRYEAAKKRALGPSAFVETSKLERAVLATEKELVKLVEDRAVRTARTKKLIKKMNVTSNIIILMMYWGVAMLAIDGSRINDGNIESLDEGATDSKSADVLWKGFLFPLSSLGLDYKIAQVGIDKDMKSSCVGALAVVWAARVTCGEIIDIFAKWGLP